MSSKRRLKAPLARPGMPSPDSVREIVEKVTPKGRRFQILKTTETDSYDRPKSSRKK